MTPEQILNRLNWRYATKKFDRERQISAADWQTLEQSLVLSPSSFGLQPWKFLVIRNADLRQQLQQSAWNQSQVVDASHLVVLASKTDVQDDDVDRYIQRVTQVRQMPPEKLAGMEKAIKGFLQAPPFPLDTEAWSTRQVYLALGFLIYSAALLDIDTCPIEGFQPAKFDEALGLNAKGYSSKVVCALGYRSPEDKVADMAKVRYETAEVVEYIG
ncbi:MAG: NAD(P)H-dependent oxidoreductase [Cyanobacteria bacterium J06623_7]